MKRLTVISLGGGVQSSVMALMASKGAFDSVPDCAIFADTHWEPPSLYTQYGVKEGVIECLGPALGVMASLRGRQHDPLPSFFAI